MRHFNCLKWAYDICEIIQFISKWISLKTDFKNQENKRTTCKIAILMMFSTFLFSASALAQQIDNNRFRVTLDPEPIGTCGGANNSLENVEIEARHDSCHAFSITFTLPDGIEYVSNTAVLASLSGSNDFALTEGGSATSPIFYIERDLDANWVLGDKVLLSFERSANCDAVQFQSSGGLFKDAHTINFADVGGANFATDNDVSIKSYSLLAASLNISSIPTIDANVSETYTRNIVIAQGGNGCIESFVHTVTVGSDVDDLYELYYGPSILVPTSVVYDPVAEKTTFNYDINLNNAPFLNTVGDLNNCFDNDESIVLEERFRVDDCVDTSIIHNAYWGCSSGVVCQAAASQTGSVNFGANVPELELTKTAGATTDLCNSIAYTVKIENLNTAAGSTAIDVAINFGLGSNGSPITSTTNNPLWAFDYRDTRQVDNFRMGSITDADPEYPITTTTRVSSSSTYATYGSGGTVSIPADFFQSDPDGIGFGLDDLDNDGFFDDLPPGGYTELTFDYTLNPRDNCGQGRYDYMVWEHTYFDVNYKDQCKGNRNPERIDLSYFNIIRDYQNPTEIEAPTDLSNNEDFVVAIAPSLYVDGTGAPNIDGLNSMLSSDASSVFTITLTVPAGITLQSPYPTEFNQVGNEITYSTTNLSGGHYKEWTNFPLNFSCGPSGVQSIAYKTNYTATGASGICWDQDIHCGTVEMYTHCPGACVGPVITDFDANRITGGWTDASMTTLVTLNENDHVLNKYMAGDLMTIKTSATINNASLDNLFLDVEYHVPTEDTSSGAEIISFVEGQITINDISGTPEIGTLTAPSLFSSSSKDHVLTFDLSNFRSLIRSDYEYGEGLEADTVDIEITFQFSSSFKSGEYFQLNSLRGEFYAFTDFPANTVRLGCDTWGDRAYYARGVTSAGTRTEDASGCTPMEVYKYLTQSMATGDMHPNEYRPINIFESLIVDIPQGARFTGNVTSASVNGSSTANGELIAEESNGQVIIRPGTGFENYDQRSTFYPRYDVEFIGTCQTPSSSTYNHTFTFVENAYSSANANTIPGSDISETKSLTYSSTFNYQPPTFLLQSPLPVVNGDAFEVDFDVEITNTSLQDIDFNWLQVTIPNGITIDGAYSLSGGVETAVNYYEAGDKLWVEADAVASLSSKVIRFKANYTNCDVVEILVEHGWDCSGYPGYPDAAIDVSDFQATSETCYLYKTTLTLDPKPAQVQMTFVDQPSVGGAQDLCTPFQIELDVSSTQIADLVNPYVEFTIPGGDDAINLNSILVEYPKNSNNIEAVSATKTNGIARLNLIEHSAIAATLGINGNPAENGFDLRTAHVVIDMSLGCNFISNSFLTFRVYGEMPCGDPAYGNGQRLVSNSIQVSGAVAPYDALSVIGLPGNGAPIDGCGVQETINISTKIQGGTTGNEDYALVTLAPGIEYVSGTFSENGLYISEFESISTVGNHQEMIVKYPPGVLNGQDIEFEFDIVTLNETCDSDGEVQIVNYVLVNGLSCSPTETCSDFQVATGSTYEILPLELPSLAVDGAASGTYFEEPNGSFDITVSLDLINDGGADANAGYLYNVYCDDGAGNKFGSSIGSGSISSAIAEGVTISETLTFNSSSVLCASKSIIIEFLPSDSNCMCEPFTAIVPITASPVANNDISTGNTTNTPVTFDIVGNDSDPDGTIDPTTVSLDANSVPSGVCDVTDAEGECIQVSVPDEGVWTLNPTTGEVTFTPDAGFTDDPSIMDYTVKDNDGNESNEATITIDYDPQPPVANNDNSVGNTTNTAVTMDILGNDTDPDGTVDPTTVSLEAHSVPGGVCDVTDTEGECMQVSVPDEGVWTVNPTTGAVTFTPNEGFTANPTVMDYTVKDNDGNESNEAIITIEYDPQSPVANNNSSTGNTTNTPVTIDVVDNDTDPDGNIDSATVSLEAHSVPNGVCDVTDADGECTQVSVPDEGVWTVNPTTGAVTFTPNEGFTANPTVMDYTVKDNDGNESNEAIITIEYDPQLPVANNDNSIGNTTNTSVTVDVIGNDTDPDGNIDPATVSLDASSVSSGLCDATDAEGECTQVTAPGEGVWTVNPTTGTVTFTPEAGFTLDPTVIEYSVKDNDGNESNVATITIDYDPQLPIATDDISSGHITGDEVIINIVGNDTDADGHVVSTTVSLDASSVPSGICNTTDAEEDCTQVTVPGEGTWSVNPTTGVVTFTPETGFTGDPSIVEYTIDDNDGNTSNPSSISIDYDQCNGLGEADCDGDGVPNYQEVIDGTDPNNPCDFEIASMTIEQTGAYLNADCDGDGVTNGDELEDGTNPEDPCDYIIESVLLDPSGDYLIIDCDGDGVLNGTEVADGTNPLDPCDFIDTSITLERTGWWLIADCDGDQVPNGQEIIDGTNPYEPCSAIGGMTPSGVVCDIVVQSDLVGPGMNEGIFKINNIESYNENTVKIYNRWGVLVYETRSYDNRTNAFRGISNGRVTIKQNLELPVGTYFYVIDYMNNGDAKVKSGYLYVNR